MPHHYSGLLSKITVYHISNFKWIPWLSLTCLDLPSPTATSLNPRIAGRRPLALFCLYFIRFLFYLKRCLGSMMCKYHVPSFLLLSPTLSVLQSACQHSMLHPTSGTTDKSTNVDIDTQAQPLASSSWLTSSTKGRPILEYGQERCRENNCCNTHRKQLA